MTNEIPMQQWAKFFDDLTKKRFEWQTKIEVISGDMGSQILDEGLPLMGITVEQKKDESFIGIIVGQDSAHHQTHNISNPTKVAYLSKEENHGGVVEIEEADGTKTLIHIIEPMPLVINYAENHEIKAA
jgi:hypothetical protein